MTGRTQHAYIAAAIEKELLTADARHNAAIVSLTAPSEPNTSIQFWQLFSVLGVDVIVAIVKIFYERVFADEDWFVAPFARIGGVDITRSRRPPCGRIRWAVVRITTGPNSALAFTTPTTQWP